MISKGLIFTYALTYGGAVAALVNPFYGLLIYIVFAIIKPPALWHWSVPEGHYSRIIAIAMLIGWAYHGFGNWSMRRAGAIMLAFTGFVVGCAISAAVAPNTAVASVYLEGFLKVFIALLVGLTVIQSTDQLRALAWVIVISQGYMAYEENVKYLDGYFNNPSVTENGIAHMMAIGCGVAFFLGLGSDKRWQRWLAFSLSGMMVHAVFFHMSRGAMLGVMVTLAMSAIVLRRQPKFYWLMGLGVILGLLLAGPEVREEFSTVFASEDDRDVSAQGRFDLWEDMWDATKQRPVLGVGPAHWPLLSEDYGWPPGKEGHGLWMQVTCENGIPAGICFIGFYLITFLYIWPLATRSPGSQDPIIGCCAQAVAVAIPAFVVEAMVGSFSALELPYYIVLLGAVTLKLSRQPSDVAADDLSEKLEWNDEHSDSDKGHFSQMTSDSPAFNA